MIVVLPLSYSSMCSGRNTNRHNTMPIDAMLVSNASSMHMNPAIPRIVKHFWISNASY